MRLKACSLLFLVWSALVSTAQGPAKCVVCDAQSNKPLAFAEVFIEETGELKLTGENGCFEFNQGSEKSLTLMVSMTGYESRMLPYHWQDSILRIALQPIASDLAEVLIREKREAALALKLMRPVQGTAIYSGRKNEVVHLDLCTGNKAGNNAREMYAKVAGLNIYENGDAGLQLNIGGRGLDPNRTANFNTRQNGYDISADVLGYPESYYTPPAEALEEIQIIRGAASLQYGTQFGGLINFKFREPNPAHRLVWNSRQTLGSYGLFTSFNSLNGRLGRFSYSTWFNYKKGDGFRPNAGFESSNYYGMLRFTPRQGMSIQAEYTHLNYLAQQAGGLTDTRFAQDPFYSNRERNWFHVNWNLYALRLDHKINSRTNWSLCAHGLDAKRDALGFRGDQRRPERNPILESDDPALERDLLHGVFRNWSMEARLLHRYTLLNKRTTLLVGSKYYQARNRSVQGPGPAGSDPLFRFENERFPSYPHQSDFLFPNKNLAVFAEQILNWGKKLSITPGLRTEYIHTQSKGHYTLVRFDNAGNEIFRQDSTDNRNLKRRFVLGGIGISYKATKSIEAYANWSSNYRSVTFSDIRVVNPTFLIDPQIRDERGYTQDIGLRGRIQDLMVFDAGMYCMRYNDRIGTILVQSGANKGDRMRKNVGDARILGLETYAEWNLLGARKRDSSLLKWTVFLNLALTHSEYLGGGVEEQVSGKRVEFVPFLNLKSGSRMSYGNVTVHIQYTYLSAQFTDAENTPVPEEGDQREGIIGEIPAYMIWDLGLSYKWRLMRLETGLNNFTNRPYFTRRATGYPGPGIIPAEPRSGYFTLSWQIPY